MEKFADLPFASTLCGSCSNVCPVKIDIHNQLYKWRQELVKAGYTDKKKTMAMKLMATTLASPTKFRLAGKMGRFTLKYAPFTVNNSLNPWYKGREMPVPPKQSFSEWYKERNR
jgi:L-lactate dehydrogenase complex protein LldF